MQDNTFRPPNAWWLSDNVFSEVAVRHTSSGPDPVRKNSTYSRPRPQPIKRASTQHYRHQRESRPTQRYAQPPSSIVRKTSLTSPPSSGEGANNFFKDLRPAEVTLMLHRERRRLVQQRYRKKKDNYAADLEVLVFQLQKEVEELHQTLQDMNPSNGLTESTVWKVAVEYFRLFRDGFKPSVPVSELCRSRSTLCADQAHKQTQFLRAVLAQDAVSNAGYGLEVALEEWRQVSLHHRDLTIELNRMERGPDNSVVAYMDGVTTITAEMLQNALSSFRRKEGQEKCRVLAAKLVGQQLVIPSTVYFQWDDRAYRITSLRYVSDMLTPLLKLLGNLEDVASVLGTTLDIHYWSKKANPKEFKAQGMHV